jgi:protein-L-isoaspartate(D-aspartate) O-methyltransferase
MEIDPDLAFRSRTNLADRPNVEVFHADGGDRDPGPADAVFINAGATHPRPVWLDALRPGGRMLLPLTGPLGNGWVLKVVRQGPGYAAGWVSGISIFPCAGARDEEAAGLLRDAFGGGGGDAVRSLRRDRHERGSTCWFHGDAFCLSTAHPDAESPGGISSA